MSLHDTSPKGRSPRGEGSFCCRECPCGTRREPSASLYRSAPPLGKGGSRGMVRHACHESPLQNRSKVCYGRCVNVPSGRGRVRHACHDPPLQIGSEVCCQIASRMPLARRGRVKTLPYNKVCDITTENAVIPSLSRDLLTIVFTTVTPDKFDLL